MEELQARHRKEQRDLQSKVTQKKKQASKKTRKGVNEECDKLEEVLEQKQQEEIASFHGEVVNGNDATEPTSEQSEDLTLKIDVEDEEFKTDDAAESIRSSAVTNGHYSRDANKDTQEKKPNRQKARLARRAAEQEELARQAAEEAKNLPDLKKQERDRMLESMKEKGLQEKEIQADGHCLYSAIADQLEQLRIPLGAEPLENPTAPYRVVRAKAAQYIEQHQDDFVPFLEEPLPDYLHKVRDTGEWGGQLELMALAKTYSTDINVLRDFGRVERIESGSEKDDKIIWLGYYKHGFGLGEHYNSLRKAP